MEDWAFADDRELMSFKGLESCSTCDHFGYVTLAQCQVLDGCHLKERLLAPGDQVRRRCEHWQYATPWALRSKTTHGGQSADCHNDVVLKPGKE